MMMHDWMIHLIVYLYLNEYYIYIISISPNCPINLKNIMKIRNLLKYRQNFPRKLQYDNKNLLDLLYFQDSNKIH